MDLERVMLSEISQTVKDKYYDFIYMWDLKSKPNKQIKQSRSRKQTDGYQRGSGWEMDEAGERY